MTSGFIVLTSDVTYLSNTIYILNKVDYDADWITSEEPFKYAKTEDILTPYQIQMYYLLLNYQKFLEKLDAITNTLSDTSNRTVISKVGTIKVIIIIILIAHLFL